MSCLMCVRGRKFNLKKGEQIVPPDDRNGGIELTLSDMILCVMRRKVSLSESVLCG